MNKKKFIKDKNGNVRATATTELQLEKPFVNEYYDINVFNTNMDKVDRGIKEVKDLANSKADSSHTHSASDIEGISLNAKSISFDNSSNSMSATNVQNAIEENKTSITSLHREVNGQRTRGINIANTIIDKIEGVSI